jgi:hypothetical protein
MEKGEDINSISPEKKLETPEVDTEWKNMEPEEDFEEDHEEDKP